MLGIKLRNATGAKEKAPARVAGKKNLLSFDLLYQLSYMSVIACSGIPRNRIFERAATLPGASADYFRKVELTKKRLQYDYAKACRLIGESAKEEDIKALLLRFSTALISGEPEANFLAREAEARFEAYNNDYFKKLEALKMWADAFVSLTLSAVLVIIISIVSTMIWKIEVSFIVGTVVIAIGSTAIGVWVIYLTSPRETTVLKQAGSREQKLVRRLFGIVLPAGVIVAALLSLTGMNLGLILMAIAAIVFPIGLISATDAKYVRKRDAEVGAFLRSLGGVSTAIGATVKDALNRLDLDAIHTLKPNVKRLHTRLMSGIGKKLCWNRFITETGSELVSRSVGMFYDAIELGGDPQQAGYRASLFANNIDMLRSRRKIVSEPFRWLCIAMHAAVTMLLLFITEVIMIFGNMLAQAEKAMPKGTGGAAPRAFTSFTKQYVSRRTSCSVFPVATSSVKSSYLRPF